MSIQTQQAKPDFALFDVLRATAALLVVASHARDLIVKDFSGGGAATRLFYAGTGLGRQAVVIFFVISGFWVGGSVLRRIESSRWSWRLYLFDRLTRLWPPLMFAMLCGAILDIAGSQWFKLPIYQVNMGEHSFVAQNYFSFGVQEVLGNLMFLQGRFVHVFGSNGPLWSLSREFWFYMAFPLIVLLAHRSGRLVTKMVAVIVAVAVVEVEVGGFVIWLMGVFLSLAVARTEGKVLAFRPVYYLLGAGICGFGVITSRTDAQFGGVGDLLLGLGFCLVMYCWLVGRQRLPSAFEFLSWYGAKASYSLYITHFPLLLLAAGFLDGASRQTEGVLSTLEVVGLVVLCVGFSLAASFVTEQRTTAIRAFFGERIKTRSVPI